MYLLLVFDTGPSVVENIRIQKLYGLRGNMVDFPQQTSYMASLVAHLNHAHNFEVHPLQATHLQIYQHGLK